MVEYGCQVANKYGMISDDEDLGDPSEFVERVHISAERAAAQKKAEPAKPVQAPKEAVKTAGKENRPTPSGERGRGGRGRGARGGGPRPPRDSTDIADRFGENRRGGPRGAGAGGRGGPRPFRGRGGNASHVGSGEENKEVSFDENNQENTQVEFEGGRGRGRGGRGGFGGERRGRGGPGGFRGRQFDRQSGSDRAGVRPFDKKDGHGRGNWGNEKDELTGETEALPQSDENVEAVPETPREKTAEELAAEAEAAELAKQKTLKEFKAAQKKDSAAFNTRQAGEGESQNFGKLVPIAREVFPEKEEEEVTYIRKNKKQVLDINIQFTEPNRGGRDREYRDRGADRSPRGAGGRGGPRGGPRGGRGGSRPGGAGYVPFDASEDAFPALGAK